MDNCKNPKIKLINFKCKLGDKQCPNKVATALSQILYHIRCLQYQHQYIDALSLMDQVYVFLKKRAKFIIDSQFWIELYARYVEFYQIFNEHDILNIGDIPVRVVTRHNDMVPWIKQSSDLLKGPIMHFDTHEDMNDINNIDQLYDKNRIKTNKIATVIWDIGAAITGMQLVTKTHDIIWVMPKWVPWGNIIKRDMWLGVVKKTKRKVHWTSLSNFANYAQYFHNSQYTKKKSDNLSIGLEMNKIPTSSQIKKTMNKWNKFYFSRVHTDGSTPNWNRLIELIDGNEFILDIDLDYFVTNGAPFRKKFWEDNYDLQSDLRFPFPNDITVPRNVYENKEKWQNDLSKEMNKINKRIKNFEYGMRLLKNNDKKPCFISMCDSTGISFTSCNKCASVTNEYVPIYLALYVHTEIYNILKRVWL
jgi:hypothetical protein